MRSGAQKKDFEESFAKDGHNSINRVQVSDFK